MKKHIPNIITTFNLLFGCVAVLFVVSGDLIAASFLVLLGIFFDFFDGLTARLLHAQSDVGAQLDSMADLITSGLAPSLIMVQLLSKSYTGEFIDVNSMFLNSGWNTYLINYMPLFGLLITIASAYRLAKFNVDTRQTHRFIGLPTPANTLLILCLPLIYHFQYSELAEQIIFNKGFLIGLTLLSSILLNVELPLFALKFKTWDFKNNKIRYVFLALCLLALITLKFIAIPIIIFLYIMMSIFWKEEG